MNTVKTKQKHILCIIGTRPEAIKMAPIIWALKKASWAKLTIVATAQHRHMLDQMLVLFNIKPDIDLDIMTENQSLSEMTARLIQRLSTIFQQTKPDCVLAQGDTTSVFIASLISFYEKIPFGHIEAGLRTHDLYYPFPEEANRVLTARLTAFHFAPTVTAKKALLKENIDSRQIYVTGNTVIDTLLSMVKKLKKIKQLSKEKKIKNNLIQLIGKKKLILVTAHRRENFGENFLQICAGLKKIAEHFQDVLIIYPVHLNPNIRQIAQQELKSHQNIVLCEPLDYLPFIQLMQKAYLILTDSGGVQEEAPALGKPVLVLRNETERPEAVKAGVVKLVGLNSQTIFLQTKKLLTDKKYYASMAKGVSPYGDGKAAARIVSILKKGLK